MAQGQGLEAQGQGLSSRTTTLRDLRIGNFRSNHESNQPLRFEFESGCSRLRVQC